MKKIMITLLAPLALIGNMMLPSATMAQQCNITRTPYINSRQYNQEVRISQGVRSGELTQAEAARLQREEARIQHEKREAKENGFVSYRERRELNHDLNKTSRDIYRLKHNGWERPWAR